MHLKKGVQMEAQKGTLQMFFMLQYQHFLEEYYNFLELNKYNNVQFSREGWAY
jgi:hypothetical protein